jgi:hypothetical protein
MIPVLSLIPASFGQEQQNEEDLFLIRVERINQNDFSRLLDGGVPVVMEMLNCLFAEGTLDHLQWLDSHGYSSTIMDDQPRNADYLIIGLRPDSDMDAVHELGEMLHQEENWLLVRVEQSLSFETLAMAKMFVTRMPHETMSPPKPLDKRWEKYLSARTEGFSPADPLVQKIVDNIDTADIQQFWQDLTANPPTGTRYSTHQGCEDAADYCYNLYTSLGLPSEYHDYNPSHAPNVIATQEGAIYPDHVYIIEGHLDDLPSSPPAPGADDNASGSVTSLEAAYAMSCWAFKSTVKYMVVTGEEQGLLGSKAYANRAQSEGENILGVINMDMNGWEGDGVPTPENLDVNYNGPSQWLGELFDECSQKYSTGLVVDDFYCPSLSASDHYPFWQKGWHAICGITDNEGYCGHGGNYPHYHTSDDTIPNCGDPSLFYGAVKTSVATLAEMAEPFKVTMKKPYYACGTGIEVVLGDRDLDTDPGSQETIMVEVWSDTEPTPELLTLTEREVSSMIFDGSIPTNEDPPVGGDGFLSVTPGDTVETRYIDDLDCDGATGVTYTSSAQIDCVKPLISDVNEEDITDTSATIVWNTDEASTTVVHWGEVTPPPVTSTDLNMVTNHAGVLTDLQECTVYYYSVESEDIAGNIATDDNGAQYYHFETYGDFGAGLQPCHAGRVTVDADIYTCAETVTFSVVDMDLNMDPFTAETTSLNVTSTTESDPETIVATETGPNTSRFAGSIQLDQGAPAFDGLLQVEDGDVVTVTYMDADDGTGAADISFDTAMLDCRGPSISNLQIVDITDQRMTVRFDTDEPGNTVVEWGSTPSLGESITKSALTTIHEVLIKQLDICELLYLRVSSTDADGNTAVGDLNGEPYMIHTWDIPGLYWRETFEGNTSGWTLQGEWEIGTPQGLGGSDGLPDPTEAYNNSLALGSDLTGMGSFSGDYENDATEHATGEKVDASSWSNTKLLLYRQLNVRDDDLAKIIIMDRNKAKLVYDSNYQTIGQGDYALDSYDVSSLVDGKREISVRFSIESDPDNIWYDDGVSSGWNIDDVILKDGSLPDYGACGGCGVAPSFNGARSAADNDACGSNGVTVSWDAAVSWGTGGSGTYAVYRDIVPDFTPSMSNLVASGTAGFSYNDLTAPTDQDLYYIVRAENDETCGTGPNNSGMTDGNLVYAAVTETTSRPVPDEIMTVQVGMINHAHVRLSWEATYGASTYRIYRSDDPQSGYIMLDETDELIFDDNNEGGNSNSYYYKVRGVNACGQEGL